MVDYIETFNKADGVGLGPDLPWTDVTAGMRTVTQRATCTTASVSALSTMNTDLGTPDMGFEAELVDFGNLNYFDIQFMLRYVDINNYYTFMRGWRTTNANYFYNFRKVIGGVITDTYTALAWTNGEIFGGTVIGDEAIVYVNDIQIATFAATELEGTKVGMGAFRSSTASTRNMFANQVTYQSFIDPPPVPANLVAIAGSGSVVDVSWDVSAGADMYDIQREKWFGDEVPL